MKIPNVYQHREQKSIRKVHNSVKVIVTLSVVTAQGFALAGALPFVAIIVDPIMDGALFAGKTFSFEQYLQFLQSNTYLFFAFLSVAFFATCGLFDLNGADPHF